MDFISIFFLLGGFSLLRLVYEDIKDLMIDERQSYYMFGVSAVIFLYLDLILVWLILTLLTGFVIAYLKTKIKQNFIGDGDISIISWILPGLFVLNWLFALIFSIVWCVVNVFQHFLAQNKTKQPGTIALAIALFITWFIALYFFS